jgi:hypothetical protein
MGSQVFTFVVRFSLPALLAVFCGTTTCAQEIGELFEPLETPWLLLNKPLKSEEEAEEDYIETDRDSFTPATTTAGRGRVIFESAYSSIENRVADSTHSFPEIITRIGITERTELRVGWNYEIGGGGSVSGDAPGELLEEPGANEESQMLYGIKTQVTDQSGWIPESACILQGTTPTSGPETASAFQLGYVIRLGDSGEMQARFLASLCGRSGGRRSLQSVGAVRRAQGASCRTLECARRVFWRFY